MVATQSQVARPPFVGLWTRLPAFTREGLLKPLRDRTIVRATSLRGTIHVMTAEDFVGLRGALQPAMTRGMEAILKDRARDLDYAALEKEARAFFRGGPSTFDALRKHLKAKNPKADERALAYIIRIMLPLVQVPTDATWGFPAAADFTIADSWLKTTISTKSAAPMRWSSGISPRSGPPRPLTCRRGAGCKGCARCSTRCGRSS